MNEDSIRSLCKSISSTSSNASKLSVSMQSRCIDDFPLSYESQCSSDDDHQPYKISYEVPEKANQRDIEGEDPIYVILKEDI